ncbi:MAG: LysE family translocator [Myxococcota bacterium]
MTLAVWTAYVVTVLMFMVTPGPSHLLMVSNSLSHGFRRSLATGMGDLTANALQMLAAGFGLSTLLMSSGEAFLVVKWLGVAYLLWMGLNKLLRPTQSDLQEAKPASSTQLFLQGFVTSAANPKAVVFFAALFPQFIEPELAVGPQLLALGATYIAIDGLFLACYGAGAQWLAQSLTGALRSRLDRAVGLCLIGAAVLLGAKSLPQR